MTIQTKAVKKVRIQSPHSPNHPGGGGGYFQKHLLSDPNANKFPALAADTFDQPINESFERDVTKTKFPAVPGSTAPANPFSKTLANLEQTDSDEGFRVQETHKSGPNAARASMDVESFKRMLMAGNAGAGVSNTRGSSSGLPVGINFGMNNGSSTDTSSLSKTSSFEVIQDAHPESPQTTNEILDNDEDQRYLHSDSTGTTPDRKKPPPPSSRHGKLLKLELGNDFADHNSLQVSPNTPPHRSPIDVHKPLPAAPSRASHESDWDSSIFDRESLGKTPEPPSPTQTFSRKGPPLPPMRRHSQLLTESRHSSSPGGGRLSPNSEENSSFTPTVIKHVTTAPMPSHQPPPPPPTRRPASIRNSSYVALPQSPGSYLDPERPSSALSRTLSSSAPLPPPSRHSSLRHTSNPSSGRPPSISSVDMSSTGRRSGMTPPPPPPPRQRASSRNSMEAPSIMSPGSASARTSGEYTSRRSGESARRPSEAIAENEETGVGVVPQRKSSIDTSSALTDLAKLQREIEELRQQSERRVG